MRLALAFLVIALGSPVPDAPAVPPDSVYRLELELENQQGARTTLDALAGQAVLISMFYGHCPHVCPMLVSSLQRLEQELTGAQKRTLRVMLVSLDPERDTPAKLAEIAQRHRVDGARWTFTRTDARAVRKLAAVLDIQYRQLPDGEFNHSTVIALLAPDGRIIAQTSKLGVPEPAFVERLRHAVGPGDLQSGAAAGATRP